MIQINREEFTEDVIAGMTIPELASKYKVGTSTVTRRKRAWNLTNVSPNARARTTEEYKELLKDRPIEVLGQYVHCKSNLLHKCKDCNHEWSPRPEDVLDGTGCPNCVNTNNGTKYDYLYVIEFEDSLFKVGVTNSPRMVRYFGEPYTVHSFVYCDGKAHLYEKELLSAVPKYNTGRLKTGNTETYSFL